MAGPSYSRLVFLVLGVAACLFAAVALVGDRVGVRVVGQVPAPQTVDVSTRSVIRVTFGQPVIPAADPLNINPALPGELTWTRTELLFTPRVPLEPGTTYHVTLRSGIASEQRRQVLRPVTWSFQTGQLRLLYIRDGELFTRTVADRAPQRFVAPNEPVRDFDVSPDGTHVLFSAAPESGVGDLWLATTTDSGTGRSAGVRKVLECGEADCSSPRWQPGGQLAVYTRRQLPSPPRPFWLNATTGETWPVFDDSLIIGYDPTWSADGAWLAFVSPLERGIRLINVRDERQLVLPSRLGEAPAWDPTTSRLALADLVTDSQERVTTDLSVYDLSLLTADRLESGFTWDDTSPSWSPDGSQLAFIRRRRSASDGGQVWVRPTEGGPARQLTDQMEFDHGGIAWSPDGTQLTAHRVGLADPDSGFQVAVVALAGGPPVLIDAGRAPGWLY